jgi:hypothetical protein
MAKAKRLEDRHPHAEVLDYLSGFADWSGRSSPMHGLTTRIDLVEGLLHWRDVEGFKEAELEGAIDELIAADLIVETELPFTGARYLGRWVDVDMGLEGYRSVARHADWHAMSATWIDGEGWLLKDSNGEVVCRGCSLRVLEVYFADFCAPAVVPFQPTGELAKFLAKRIDGNGDRK